MPAGSNPVSKNGSNKCTGLDIMYNIFQRTIVNIVLSINFNICFGCSFKIYLIKVQAVMRPPTSFNPNKQVSIDMYPLSKNI